MVDAILTNIGSVWYPYPPKFNLTWSTPPVVFLDDVEYLNVPIPIFEVVYDKDSGSPDNETLKVVVPTPNTEYDESYSLSTYNIFDLLFTSVSDVLINPDFSIE